MYNDVNKTVSCNLPPPSSCHNFHSWTGLPTWCGPVKRLFGLELGEEACEAISSEDDAQISSALLSYLSHSSPQELRLHPRVKRQDRPSETERFGPSGWSGCQMQTERSSI